jgi:hypothetical protein
MLAVEEAEPRTTRLVVERAFPRATKLMVEWDRAPRNKFGSGREEVGGGKGVKKIK